MKVRVVQTGYERTSVRVDNFCFFAFAGQYLFVVPYGHDLIVHNGYGAGGGPGVVKRNDVGVVNDHGGFLRLRCANDQHHCHGQFSCIHVRCLYYGY